MVIAPEAHRFPIGRWRAIQAKRVQVKRGPHGFEVKTLHAGAGALAAQQVDEQRGNQRPMDDEAWIASTSVT